MKSRKGRYDFDCVRMTDKIKKKFHKGTILIPAKGGKRIRFVDGVSEPLAEKMVHWALTYKDGKQFVGCKDIPKVDRPTAIGEAKEPLPPGLKDLPEPPGEDEEEESKFPGEADGYENIAEYKVEDAISTIEGDETGAKALDIYLAQEQTKKNKARKTVLNAIEEKRKELAE